MGTIYKPILIQTYHWSNKLLFFFFLTKLVIKKTKRNCVVFLVQLKKFFGCNNKSWQFVLQDWRWGELRKDEKLEVILPRTAINLHVFLLYKLERKWWPSSNKTQCVFYRKCYVTRKKKIWCKHSKDLRSLRN